MHGGRDRVFACCALSFHAQCTQDLHWCISTPGNLSGDDRTFALCQFGHRVLPLGAGFL
jgi:hypothetical protein